jgi:ABC-type multidrug transport system ATPase subunit
VETIIAENIVRLYNNKQGVCGVSLSVQAGQCLGVLGANGSGKTTLTRLVAGLDQAESGRISVLGKPAYSRTLNLRRRCGVALDTPAHWETLSGRQNLWFFAQQFGLSGSNLIQRVDELLSEADLTMQADEPVSSYSFGMRRKLNIIEALSHDPELLILDEPSAGADETFLERLEKHIHRRCEKGRTTWITDNDADWLSRAATNAILLSEGRIKAQGSVPELMNSLGNRNRIDILLEQSGFSATPNISGINVFHCEGKHVTAEVVDNPDLPAELLSWITSCGGSVRSMEVRSVTLHEALKRQAAQQETKL